MKKLFLSILSIISFLGYAQVGINNTNPQASLDVTASNVATPNNTDGILIPRIDNFPVTNPTAAQDGMMVYVTGAGTPGKGFYYWDNSSSLWVNVKENSDADWYEAGDLPPNDINDNIYTYGNVGVGIAPQFKLDINNSSTSYIARFINTYAGATAKGIKIQMAGYSSTSQNYYIGFYRNNGLNESGRITGNNSIGVLYLTTSDKRLKNKIVSISNALNIIDQIKPRKYEYKEIKGVEEFGFIAQELQLIYPQAVTGDPNGNVKTNPMMVDYSRLTPLLAAGIKELKEKVDVQQKEINVLKSENKQLKQQLSIIKPLEKRLKALENKVNLNSKK